MCVRRWRYVVKHSLTFHSWPQYYVHSEGEHIFAFHTSRAHESAMCVSVYVCVNEIERQERSERRGRGMKHSPLIQRNLSRTMSQYHNISHILRITNLAVATSSSDQRSYFCLVVLDAAGPRYSLRTAQMGEAIASVPQYRMQKCLVCFNTDKADIFRGVSQTIAMEEQSPIWQCSLSENPLCHAQWEAGETKHSLSVYQLLSRLYLGRLGINKTSPRRLGLLKEKKKKKKIFTLRYSLNFINISSRFNVIQKHIMHSSPG